MKVTKIDGKRRMYIFESGAECSFDDKARYAELKGKPCYLTVQPPPVIVNEAVIVNEMIIEPDKLKRKIKIIKGK